jgi:hypothetical protein
VADREREQAILDAALPHLEAFAEPPRRVLEQHDPEHPGHTFDFAGRRSDGTPVAIEITEATSRRFREDGSTLERWQQTVETALVDARVDAGTYILSTQSDSSPPIKRLVDRIVDAARSLVEGSEATIAQDVRLQRLARTDDGIRFAWVPGTAGGVQRSQH